MNAEESTKNSALRLMGIIFITLGVIGFVGIIVSFDWESYNNIKGLSYSFADELAVMKSQLTNVWVIGISVLVVNVAIGILLMAIDRIIEILESSKWKAHLVKVELEKIREEIKTSE